MKAGLRYQVLQSHAIIHTMRMPSGGTLYMYIPCHAKKLTMMMMMMMSESDVMSDEVMKNS